MQHTFYFIQAVPPKWTSSAKTALSAVSTISLNSISFPANQVSSGKGASTTTVREKWSHSFNISLVVKVNKAINLSNLFHD